MIMCLYIALRVAIRFAALRSSIVTLTIVCSEQGTVLHALKGINRWGLNGNDYLGYYILGLLRSGGGKVQFVDIIKEFLHIQLEHRSVSL